MVKARLTSIGELWMLVSLLTSNARLELLTAVPASLWLLAGASPVHSIRELLVICSALLLCGRQEDKVYNGGVVLKLLTCR